VGGGGGGGWWRRVSGAFKEGEEGGTGKKGGVRWRGGTTWAVKSRKEKKKMTPQRIDGKTCEENGTT